MSDVERHGSGGAFEDLFGYSRVVRVGSRVLVAGCTAAGPAGSVLGGDDAYEQLRAALDVARAALEGVGASYADVVLTRIYVTDISRQDDIARAHLEAFGDVRPVATMVEVAALIDPRMLVEIELEAHLPG